MTADAPPGYLVGRGIADITGEPAGCGMLGYGKAGQRTAGIQLRLRSRAFVIVDTGNGNGRDSSSGVGCGRVLLVVNELPLMFDSVHREVLSQLRTRYGDLYTSANVMLTATHTHAAPGGYGQHRLYNLTTHGFHRRTFEAIVDGIVAAVADAHDDLAPATLRLAHGTLLDASVNRSRAAFDRNPASERAVFPDAIDPQTTVLSIERDGRVVGVINWFATHGTSLTNENGLISGDNKGYAAYHWERLVRGVDYRAAGPPPFVAAFAQSNAGDMSPNLHQRPGSGPTVDPVENTRIIGTRQFEAAAALVRPTGMAVTGTVDARVTYLDLACARIAPAAAGDGRAHRTGRPVGGAAAIAGTAEGPGFPGFRQGPNRWWDRLSGLAYAVSPSLRDAQAPKGMVLPGGLLNRLAPFVQEKVPVQLIRIGPLYLVGVPGEVTIVAGLRLRRTVAAITGSQLRDVLVAGYSNAYLHYVTTPEEYAAQRYEGGSTLFGRWELAALQQVVAELARAMRDLRAVPIGPVPADAAPRRRPRDRLIDDAPPPGHALGDVLVDVRATYRDGERVSVTFVGANPNNDLRRGGSYLEVQRHERGGRWRTVADDGDWSTTFGWARVGRGGSRISITWATNGAEPGRYRIRYSGTVVRGRRRGELTAESSTFRVLEAEKRPAENTARTSA